MILINDITLHYDSSSEENSTATLNGCNSSDPNADALTYRWTLIGAPSEVILTPNTSNPCQPTLSLNNISTLENETTFTVKLRVTDPFGRFDEDTIQVRLNDINEDFQRA